MISQDTLPTSYGQIAGGYTTVTERSARDGYEARSRHGNADASRGLAALPRFRAWYQGDLADPMLLARSALGVSRVAVDRERARRAGSGYSRPSLAPRRVM